MTIAIKNSAVIFKNGNVAENCGCCGCPDCIQLLKATAVEIDISAQDWFDSYDVPGTSPQIYRAIANNASVMNGSWSLSRVSSTFDQAVWETNFGDVELCPGAFGVPLKCLARLTLRCPSLPRSSTSFAAIFQLFWNDISAQQTSTAFSSLSQMCSFTPNISQSGGKNFIGRGLTSAVRHRCDQIDEIALPQMFTTILPVNENAILASGFTSSTTFLTVNEVRVYL